MQYGPDECVDVSVDDGSVSFPQVKDDIDYCVGDAEKSRFY
jgi:hypothetical protein